MKEELFSAGTTLQGRDHMKEKEERRRKTKEKEVQRGSKSYINVTWAKIKPDRA
jgi:hypothetical protein